MKLYQKKILTKQRGIIINDKEDNVPINYETAIKGTTLDVYFYLLRKKEAAGVREIQRELGLSSPSVSSYHLEKLESLSVIRKNRFGNYEVAKKIDIGALNQFILIKNFTLPRFLFYAVFISVLFFGYLLFFVTFPISTGEVFAILFGGISTAICWIESYISWQNRPF